MQKNAENNELSSLTPPLNSLFQTHFITSPPPSALLKRIRPQSAHLCPIIRRSDPTGPSRDYASEISSKNCCVYSSANARSIDALLKSAEDLPVRQPLRMTTRVPTRRAEHVLDRLVSIGWIRNESRFTHLERQAVLDDRLMQEERDRRRWLRCIVSPSVSNANVGSSLSPSSFCSRSEYASSTCVAIKHPLLFAKSANHLQNTSAKTANKTDSRSAKTAYCSNQAILVQLQQP